MGRSRLSGSGDFGYGRYGLPDITISCRKEILELIGILLSDNTGRQLYGLGAVKALAPEYHFSGQDGRTQLGYLRGPDIPGQRTLPVG